MVIWVPGGGLVGRITSVISSVVVVVVAAAAITGISVSGVVGSGFVAGLCSSQVSPCETDYTCGFIHIWYFGFGTLLL